jgi:hypothetical protein
MIQVDIINRTKMKQFLTLVMLLAILLLGACVLNPRHEFNTKTLQIIPNEIPYAKTYHGHLQGMSTDFKKHIFWSHTQQLVKTDLEGNVLKTIDVQNHHGDLEYYKGKVYVAVNFGRFNEEPGLADSWVYVYNAKDLAFIEKHPTPEVIHGAGGIAIHNNRVMVVGGLPETGDYSVNPVYEYDLNFIFVKIHDIKSGYTYKGIQTACYFNNYWYFACYGSTRVEVVPKLLIVKQTTENNLEFVRSVDVDMSYGMIGLKGNEFIYCNRTLENKAAQMQLP